MRTAQTAADLSRNRPVFGHRDFVSDMQQPLASSSRVGIGNRRDREDRQIEPGLPQQLLESCPRQEAAHHDPTALRRRARRVGDRS